MHPLLKKYSNQEETDKNPFENLKISDYSFLDSISSRSECPKCKKSRKYFCYVCYTPVKEVEGKIPQLNLPIKIDIIKHKNETDGKSTSAHAALIAPHDVRVFIFPCIPEYAENEKVVLVYPSKRAKSVKEYFDEGDNLLNQYGLPFTRAVFIDSTWNQSKRILNDERIQRLPCIVLRNKISQFWRHQKNSPRWYLATIEAIHELLIELECRGNMSNINSLYNGKYDDLLFFFCFMYYKIHNFYDHESLLSYKRPLE